MTTTVTAPPPRRRARKGTALGLIAWLAGILFVLPILWMLLTSLHSEADAATNPRRWPRPSPSTATGSSSAWTAGRAPGPH